jgi:hypothetical protein
MFYNRLHVRRRGGESCKARAERPAAVASVVRADPRTGRLVRTVSGTRPLQQAAAPPLRLRHSRPV